jgi:PncC family amidohydrolase
MGEITNTILVENIVGPKLRAAQLTVATAESCTGGLVGDRLTNISGSSDYFLGGILSYSNEIKEKVLGVPREVLETVGAVSAECALAMAMGARKVIGASIGLSATGIAGPGGGSAGKPVGLVYVGIAADNYHRVERYVWSGDRIQNKRESAEAVLRLLLDYLAQLDEE